MSKLVFKTLRQEVADAVRMMILNGELKPGERIIEQNLAESLGVSRGPIREALRQIEQEGLVEYARNAGCTVKTFTNNDIYEIYLLRADLEILAVKLCDGKFSPKTIRNMEEILARMSDLSDENAFDLAIECDNAFHGCLVQEVKMERLFQLWNSMDAGNTIIFYAGIHKSKGVVLNQRIIHREVLDAIKAGNPRLITKVLLEHYMSTIKSCLVRSGEDPEGFNYNVNLQL